MCEIGKLPDLSRSMDLLYISTELETCRPTIIGLAIKEGLRTGSVKSVCEILMDQVRDGHREAVARCVGESVLQRIEKLFL